MRRTTALLMMFLATACAKKEAEAPLATNTVPPAAASATPTAAVPAVPPGMANPHGEMAPGALPAGHGAMAGHGGAPSDNAAPVAIGTFAPADRTIADTIAHKAELSGKTLEIRGRVVKANHGILDRNWLHLRDASGEADLVVTTSEGGQRGDLVKVKGVVALDKDVGAGYRYEILIENATVVVESAAATPTAAPAPQPAP